MIDASNISSADRPTGELEQQAVLSAVAKLCGPDRSAAESLPRAFKRLVNSSDWAREARGLARSGIPARNFSGQLRDVLNIPGDLVLLRNGEDRFKLLR